MRAASFLAAPLLLIAAPVMAQVPSGELTADQKGYIVYDRCMMEAAIKASYTSAPDGEIYRLAKASCTDVRTSVVAGQEGNKAYLAALDAADADKAKNFPAWIKGVRERRRARELQSQAQNAKP